GLSPSLASTLVEGFLNSLPALLAPGAKDAFTTAFLRLQKAALLVTRFKLTAEELAFFQGHGADFGGFDVNLLPTTVTATPAFPFAAWRAVASFVLVKRSLPSLPDGSPTLLDLFRAAQPAAVPA